MRLQAEACLDDRKRMVVVSYFDWEAPAGRRQRGDVGGWSAPGDWPFNLVPHRIVAQPVMLPGALRANSPVEDTRHLSGWR